MTHTTDSTIDAARGDVAQPNPGSPEAVELGCKCPVGENGHGRGAWNGAAKDEQGNPLFWVAEDCPLHGKPQIEEVDR